MRNALVPNRLVRPGRSGRRTAATLLATAALLFGAGEAAINLTQHGTTTTVAAVTAADASATTQATTSTSASTSSSSGSSASADTSVAASSAAPTSGTS
jgi:hypothetical protein